MASKKSVDLSCNFPEETAKQKLQALVESAPHKLEADVYGNGSGLNAFEKEVSDYCGVEAAVFLISGIMAQNVALKIHAKATNSTAVAFHPSSHLEIHEMDAWKHVLNLERVSLGKSEEVLSSNDVRAMLTKYDVAPVTSSAANKENELSGPKPGGPKPGLLLIELPQRELGGATPAWAELVLMTELARKQGLRVHLDGARLWEVAPYYKETANKTLQDVVGLFDSAYVSFYKGIGGMTGAMLLGSTEFVAEARLWIRRFGGTVFTYLPYWVSCKHHFNTQQNTFDKRYQNLCRVVHHLSALNLPGLVFVPAQPQSSMVHVYINASKQQAEQAQLNVATKHGYKLFSSIRKELPKSNDNSKNGCYFEWKMCLEEIPDLAEFENGYRTYLDEVAAVIYGETGLCTIM